MSTPARPATRVTPHPPAVASVRGRRNGQVAYQVLAEDLRESIARGQFSPGRRLPTEAELSARYAVSRQTVRRAYQDLVAEGLIFRVPGRGTFPTSPSPSGRYLRSVGSIEDLRALSLDTEMQTIFPLARRVDVDVASRLRVAPDELMAATTRRLHDGVPFSVTRMSVPLLVGRRLLERGALQDINETARDTVIRLLDEVSPLPLVGAEQTITAGLTPADIAPYLDLTPEDPVLRIDRLYFDSASHPVALAINYFNPNRYSYNIELRHSVPVFSAPR